MICETCRDNFTDYLEGALPDEQRRGMDDHLRACESCAEDMAAFRATIDTLRSIEMVTPPPELLQDISTAVGAAAAQGGTSWFRRWSWQQAGALAAAACVLAGFVTLFQHGLMSQAIAPQRATERAQYLAAKPEQDGVVDKADASPESVAEVGSSAGDEEQPEDLLAELVAEVRAPMSPAERREPASPALRTRRAPEREVAASREPPRAPPVGPALPAPSSPSLADAGAPPAPHRAAASEGAPSPQPPLADTAILAEAESAEAGRDRMTSSPPASPPAAATASRAAADVAPHAPRGDVGSAGPRSYAGVDSFADAGAESMMAKGAARSPAEGGVRLDFIPPQRREVGRDVIGAVVLEADFDIPNAIVTVRPQSALRITNSAPEGVVHSGPLRAKRPTTIALRMVADKAGTQAICIELTSGVPAGNASINAKMTGFRAAPETGDPVGDTDETSEVSLVFRETDVREALARIGTEGGLRVEVAPEVRGRRVNYDFRAVPAEGALRVLCQTEGYRLERIDRGFRVTKP